MVLCLKLVKLYLQNFPYNSIFLSYSSKNNQ